MSRKKRHWFWNVVLVLSVVACLLALLAHSKNWKRLEQDRLQVLSGIYSVNLPVEGVVEIDWVDRLPQMQRKHGFSAWAMEKGRFIDSLRPDMPVLVLVDNLRHPKLRIAYRDSLLLYLNLKDSLETVALHDWIRGRIVESTSAK